jgi:hypothetical protein
MAREPLLAQIRSEGIPGRICVELTLVNLRKDDAATLA